MSGICEFIEYEKSFMIRVVDYEFCRMKITFVRQFSKASILGFEFGSECIPENIILYLTSGIFDFNKSFHGSSSTDSAYTLFAKTPAAEKMIMDFMSCLRSILGDKKEIVDIIVL